MWLLVLVCVLGTAAQAQNSDGIQVNVTQGTIQGANATDGNYYVFYGIHYAGATSGENRFKPPTPAPSYPGVFHAADSNVICAQPSPSGFIGVEDCLTLSIFTRNLTFPKPVLVWLVSEEYTNTAPATSFARLVQEDILVVQINYRLSIFGFLCLGVAEAPGNVGLRDVVQGLRWIQENIASFGGDPNNVVLFGHGSGAAMVDLITLSPSSRNLVHKAIALSGSALSPWAVAYEPVKYAQALGAQLQYTRKSNEELAKLLVGTDIRILTDALNDFEFLNNTILFAPCIENTELNPNDTFLATAPINLLRSGNYSQIPYIAGYVDREGTIRAEEAAYGKWLERMQENFTNFLQVDLELGTNRANVEKNIREYYFSQRAINMETVEDFLDYQGDTLILVSVIRGAKERSLTSSSPVRLFEFAYRGTFNSDWAITTISPTTGARHGAILNYLLGQDLRPAVDDSISNSLVSRFTGFLLTGNPIQLVRPGPIWEPIRNNLTNYLLYSGGEGPSADTSVYTEVPRTNPHQQRMTFWEDLYFKYYQPPSSVSAGVNIAGVTFVVLTAQLFALLL